MTKNALCLMLALFFGSESTIAKPAKTLPVKPAIKVDPIAEAKKDVLLDMSGRIYPQDSFPETCKDLFKGAKCSVESFGRFHVESKKEGELVHSVSTFAGPEGVQVIEESWERAGHVQKAKITNHALGKVSEMEIQGNKVKYRRVDKDGDIDTSEDDYEENLVVPSTLMSYVRPKFPELMEGKEVKIRMAVLDRQEAFTFVMKKHRLEKSPTGEDILVLQLSPWSFIVKAAVSPLYFYLNPNTGEMFAFEGRSALRRKIDGKYKEMDVRVAYDYSINAYNLLKGGAKTASNNDALQTSKNCSQGGLLGTGKDAKCEVQSQ